MKKVSKFLVIVAVLFVTTYLFNYKIGNLGYINISDSLIIMLAPLTNSSYAFILAGLPTALADICLGYNYYALFTFVIKGIQSLIACQLMKRAKSSILTSILVILLGSIAYSIFDLIIYGPSIILSSLMFNGIQFAINGIIIYLTQLIIRKK